MNAEEIHENTLVTASPNSSGFGISSWVAAKKKTDSMCTHRKLLRTTFLWFLKKWPERIVNLLHSNVSDTRASVLHIGIRLCMIDLMTKHSIVILVLQNIARLMKHIHFRGNLTFVNFPMSEKGYFILWENSSRARFEEKKISAYRCGAKANFCKLAGIQSCNSGIYLKVFFHQSLEVNLVAPCLVLVAVYWNSVYRSKFVTVPLHHNSE